MSYLLVVVALALMGALVMFLLGLRHREHAAVISTGESTEENQHGSTTTLEQSVQLPGAGLLDQGLAPPLPNLPPVLLPRRPEARDVSRVRFSLGLRGYRMDQVDQVLDALAAEIELRGKRIAELEALLAEHPGGRPDAAGAAAEEQRNG